MKNQHVSISTTRHPLPPTSILCGQGDYNTRGSTGHWLPPEARLGTYRSKISLPNIFHVRQSCAEPTTPDHFEKQLRSSQTLMTMIRARKKQQTTFFFLFLTLNITMNGSLSLVVHCQPPQILTEQ
ncbi:hypothetical protein SODALDRAFT_215848 [Sodiomyces alkalinus F11]|uniref:Uncharacterized protein n=1 Tax=Sodiomyces alkalinus (strain CBS 110278 / VKM F-3762 / F11) TaxID=1314773 RepID=A0A3N2PP26_SODAK|nr:hypothetical protein SODALDRAFT_215848 [Sodiomyces alkalinus F11]ROT36265.1 hypothetical protein SODALDRAFT_215848 [Sodiomyces alkalinus F11]